MGDKSTRVPVPCALPIRMTSERVQDVACNAAVVAKLREKYGAPKSSLASKDKPTSALILRQA